MSKRIRFFLSQLHHNFTSLFSQLLPSLISIQPHIKKENKSQTHNLILISQLILLVFVFVNALTCKSDIWIIKLVNNLLCLLNIPAFVLASRHHTKIFKSYYNMFLALYSLFLGYIHQINAPLAWLETQLFPLLALSLTGSKLWFSIHSVLQIINLNQYFVSQMVSDLRESSIEEFIGQMSESSSFLIIFRMTLTLSICRSFEDNGKATLITEQQKKEIQKQKDFLLGFSHEFRNLTHAIVGNIKLSNLENLPETARNLLLRAEVSGEVLLQYINNILDSGKLEVNELEITPTSTRIYEILEQVWRVSSELMKIKGIAGYLKISKMVPGILFIDHYRILQILFNLISNAIKYTERGSVTVKIEWVPGIDIVSNSCFDPIPFNEENEFDEGLFEKTHAFSVFDDNLIVIDSSNRQINEILAHKSNNEITAKGILKITVTDTGCGIPQSTLDHVWEIFWKPKFGSSRRRYGTGLGLFVTKHLCNSMEGDIRVYTKAGKGSSFIVCIPTKPTTNQGEDIQTIKAKISQKQLKAMTVDDVQFNNLIMKTFFERLNIEVVQMAENGEEAVKKYAAQIYEEKSLHIVTMDIDMPRMNGKIAAQKIREYEIANNLNPCILIMISGDCSDSDIHECTNKNGRIRADGFLKKPASLEELVRILGNILS